MIARQVAMKQVHTKHDVSLVIRSSIYGRDEKPIYLGKSGSVLSVDGLPIEVTQQEVRKIFQDFAPIEYVHIREYPTQYVNADT